ncbi:MAG TPA: acyl-CoA dehydrogenase family protein [Planctomycetota bacterium]|nr:acyl-CoA dehydrogenase family protein [Planctomycetota bacterium]
MTFDFLAAAESVAQVAREHATAVDAEAAFPEAAIAAARKAGLFGLLSRSDVGGHGLGLRAAGLTIERIARECSSSAMVLTMHYSGTAVIEAYGSEAVRRDVASGKHLSTLAFSEAGSRSHFWAPTSTASAQRDQVVLDAHKSWVTSAHAATAYVWSSKPVAGSEASTLWLVPRESPGLSIDGPFDGMGLRGNDSAPVRASGVKVPAAHRLGADGAGFGIMMQTVLPTFALLIAGGSLGMAEALVQKTAAHAAGTKYAHLPAQNALCDLPTIRAYVARMRIEVDMAKALWQETFTALEKAQPEAPLRVLETKAAAAEVACRVADTAMRVCGGMAFRKEVGVERLFRDTRAAMVMAPTSDQLYDFVGKAVCGLPLF